MTYPSNLSATIKPNVKGGYDASFSIFQEDPTQTDVRYYSKSFGTYQEAEDWIVAKHKELE